VYYFLQEISSFFQLNVLHTELAKQLADTMVLPIIQFREKDLTGKVTEFMQLSSKYCLIDLMLISALVF
jgi:hypothetical protein